MTNKNGSNTVIKEVQEALNKDYINSFHEINDYIIARLPEYIENMEEALEAENTYEFQAWFNQFCGLCSVAHLSKGISADWLNGCWKQVEELHKRAELLESEEELKGELETGTNKEVKTLTEKCNVLDKLLKESKQTSLTNARNVLCNELEKMKGRCKDEIQIKLNLEYLITYAEKAGIINEAEWFRLKGDIEQYYRYGYIYFL